MEETTSPEPEAPKGAKRGHVTPQHLGRVLAFQVLFESDLTAHQWHASLEAHAEAVGASPRVVAFAEACIEGVSERLEELDAIMVRHAPLWPVAQLATSCGSPCMS